MKTEQASALADKTVRHKIATEQLVLVLVTEDQCWSCQMIKPVLQQVLAIQQPIKELLAAHIQAQQAAMELHENITSAILGQKTTAFRTSLSNAPACSADASICDLRIVQ